MKVFWDPHARATIYRNPIPWWALVSVHNVGLHHVLWLWIIRPFRISWSPQSDHAARSSFETHGAMEAERKPTLILTLFEAAGVRAQPARGVDLFLHRSSSLSTAYMKQSHATDYEASLLLRFSSPRQTRQQDWAGAWPAFQLACTSA